MRPSNEAASIFITLNAGWASSEAAASLSSAPAALPLPAMAVTAIRLELAAEEASRADRIAYLEEVLFAAGALSVVFTDCRDDPVLEPKPGEVRLWPETRVEALFDADSPTLAAEGRVALAQQLGCELARLAVATIPDRAWEREWLQDFHALRFGRRLWICPTHEQVNEPDAAVIQLDPGLAFGTGTHPTTRLCLEFLDALAAPMPDRVVDYGCGSGVLALAALRLGAGCVWVHDIDPQALEAACDNARRNDLAAGMRPCEEAAALAQQLRNAGGAELVIANILAAPLIELAESLTALLAARGQLVLAGLLDAQADEVILAYEPWIRLRIWGQSDGWTCLVGERP